MRRASAIAASCALAAASVAGAAAAREAPGQLARGARVADRFCYACHDREASSRGHNPLLPRLDLARFGTPDRAYASVGRLEQLSAGMTLPFQGSEEERRALASWLADAAQREHARRSRQRRAVLLGVAAAALGAAVLALRASRAPRA